MMIEYSLEDRLNIIREAFDIVIKKPGLTKSEGGSFMLFSSAVIRNLACTQYWDNYSRIKTMQYLKKINPQLHEILMNWAIYQAPIKITEVTND
jgi:hypothetical protein